MTAFHHIRAASSALSIGTFHDHGALLDGGKATVADGPRRFADCCQGALTQQVPSSTPLPTRLYDPQETIRSATSLAVPSGVCVILASWATPAPPTPPRVIHHEEFAHAQPPTSGDFLKDERAELSASCTSRKSESTCRGIGTGVVRRWATASKLTDDVAINTATTSLDEPNALKGSGKHAMAWVRLMNDQVVRSDARQEPARTRTGSTSITITTPALVGTM